jgi:hypothetical protein
MPERKRKFTITMHFEMQPKNWAEEARLVGALHSLYEGMPRIPGIGNCGYKNKAAISTEAYWDAQNAASRTKFYRRLP